METIECEYCGRTLPISEATYYEDAGVYVCPECAHKELVTCERCGDIIDRDNAYQGFSGYLCDICHDDLFG